MAWWEAVVVLGHLGRCKGIEVRRCLQAPNAVAARNIAFSWGGVKKVLEVRKIAGPEVYFHPEGEPTAVNG